MSAFNFSVSPFAFTINTQSNASKKSAIRLVHRAKIAPATTMDLIPIAIKKRKGEEVQNTKQIRSNLNSVPCTAERMACCYTCRQAYRALQEFVVHNDQNTIKLLVQNITRFPPRGFDVTAKASDGFDFLQKLLSVGDSSLFASQEVKPFLVDALGKMTKEHKNELLTIMTSLLKNKKSEVAAFIFACLPRTLLTQDFLHPIIKFSAMHTCLLSLLDHGFDDTAFRILSAVSDDDDAISWWENASTMQPLLKSAVAKKLPKCSKFITQEIIDTDDRFAIYEALITVNEDAAITYYKKEAGQVLSFMELDIKKRLLAFAYTAKSLRFVAELEQDSELKSWYNRNKSKRCWCMHVAFAKSRLAQWEHVKIPEDDNIEKTTLLPTATQCRPRTMEVCSEEMTCSTNDVEQLAAAFENVERRAWGTLADRAVKALNQKAWTQFFSEAGRVVEARSCTKEQYTFICSLVAAILRENQDISLYQGSCAVGALIYLRDYEPSQLSFESSTPDVVKNLIDTVDSVFSTVCSNCHPSQTFDNCFSIGTNDFYSRRAAENRYAQAIGNRVIGKDGKINLLLLPQMEKGLLWEENCRESFDDRAAAVLHCLYNDAELRSLIEVAACSSGTIMNNRVIRPTVGLPEGSTISDVEARKAVVISLLASWYQGGFGSCPVTAQTKSAQDLWMKTFVVDMTSLFKKGMIYRTINNQEESYLGLMPTKNYCFDSPLDKNTRTEVLLEIINVIPGLNQELSGLGAFEELGETGKTPFSIALLDAKRSTSYTLRTILSSLEQKYHVDIDRYAFMYEPPSLRLLENAVASLQCTTFENLGKPNFSSFEMQTGYATLLLSLVLDTLSSDTFKTLSAEKVVAFFSAVPKEISAAMYSIWTLMHSEDPNKGIQVSKLLDDLECPDRPFMQFKALQNLRLFASSPYEEVQVFGTHESHFRYALYEKQKNGSYVQVTKERFQTIIKELISEIVTAIDSSYTMPTSLNLESAIEMYAEGLFDIDQEEGNRASESKEQNTFQRLPIDFTAYFHAIHNATHTAMQGIYIGKNVEKYDINCTNGTIILQQLIELKQKLKTKQSKISENLLAWNDDHKFRTFLTHIPDKMAGISHEQFRIEQAPIAKNMLLQAIIAVVVAQKRVTEEQVIAFVDSLELPSTGTIRDWYRRLWGALERTRALGDQTLVWDETIEKAYINGMKFHYDKALWCLPFADTNWFDGRYYSLYYSIFLEGENNYWAVGNFTNTYAFEGREDASFSKYSIFIDPATLQAMQEIEQSMVKGKAQRELLDAIESFSKCWSRYNANKLSQKQLQLVLQPFSAATSFQAAQQCIENLLPSHEELRELIAAKSTVVDLLQQKIASKIFSVTELEQITYPALYGTGSSFKKLFLSDFAAFKTMIC